MEVDNFSHIVGDTELFRLREHSLRRGWNVLDALILLAENKRFISFFTVAVALLASAISIVLPSRYTATSTVLPPQQASAVSGLLSQATGGSLAPLAGASLGIKNPVDVYVTMFRSRTVEDAMITRFNLMSEYHVKNFTAARKIFEERSSAVAGLKDGVIRVTVDSFTPQRAAELTNAYVEEFHKLAANVVVTEAGQRRLFFERQIAKAKSDLSLAEQDFKQTQQQTGMLQPDSESRAMMESAAAIQGQIVAKQVQLNGVAAYETDDNADTVLLKRQLAELRAQLQQLTGSSGAASNLFVPKGRAPEASLDYIRKLRELKYRETIFQSLENQYELATLDEAKQGAIAQIIDRAVPPDKHSYPHRLVIVLVFGMLAFVVSCFTVWARAAFQAVRSDVDDGPKVLTLLAALRWRRRGAK